LALAAPALLASTWAPAAPADVRGDVVPPSSSTSTLGPGATAQLNAALREAWASLPGGATATVIVPGHGRWTGVVGYGNDESKRPMAPDMQSPIASVTKTFTAMLVLQEVDAGRLDLDDRLSRWYPSIPRADDITIAMLLNMSSGIADYLNGDIPGTAKKLFADPRHIYRPDALIAKGAAMPRAFDVPGSDYSYSNTNTVILGRILERTTGKTYGALLRERLFEPFGLTRTFLDQSGRLRAPHVQNYSSIYALKPGAPPIGRTTNWSQSIAWAGGGLASTVGDLGRWGRTLGTGRGAISPGMASERLEQCAPPALQTTSITMSYCLGVLKVTDRATGKTITLWHNGRLFGTVSYVGYYPITGAVVAVMSNSDLEGADGQPVSMRAKDAIEEAIPGLLGL
jgi:D-alanyl-D-alanine carboxypeptidase